MVDTSACFELTVFFSTLAAVLAAFFVSRRPLEKKERSGSLRGLFFHPLAQLGIVIVLLLVNQVLFNAYVLKVHHGDPSFIAKYIPGGGWFALLPKSSIVRLIARTSGDGSILAPSVLRVQAFLELPFTLYAYLAVARLLGRDVMRTLCRWPLLLAASVSFTITFSLVEIRLWNPYTIDDVVLRAIACVVVPPYIAWTARRLTAYEPRGAGRPTSLPAFLSFLVGAGAIAYGVLVVYDVFLLYNLGHLPHYASGLAIASIVAIGASVAAPRLSRGKTLVGETMVSMLAAFTLLFFIPSLSIRYWMMHPIAFLSGAGLIIGGGAWGFARVKTTFDKKIVVVLGLGIGAVLGVLFAGAAAIRSRETSEALLAIGAVVFLGTTAIVAFGVEKVANALANVQSVRR